MSPELESNAETQQEDALYKRAAQKIVDADFLLIATGAGFSADSGLPTYADVARNPIYEKQGIEYGDLCRVSCLKENPSLFYGFWGGCYNAYQKASPHVGYDIIKGWCDRNEEKSSSIDRLPSYYHYTSNVDGHLRRVGFPADRIHEIHGRIDSWLIVSEDSSNLNLTPAFSIPKTFVFPVEPDTLEVSPACVQDLLPRTIVKNTSIPTLLRPSVLMFDDGFDAHKQMNLDKSSKLYQAWEEAMEIKMAGTDLKLVVLEIGCGQRVPSVRQECEDVIADTASRCTANPDERCTHIRINPDHADFENQRSSSISIQGFAMNCLLAINSHVEQIRRDANSLNGADNKAKKP